MTAKCSDAPKRKWAVRCDGAPKVIEAHWWTVKGGALLFYWYDEHDREHLLKGFSPNTWVTIEQVEEQS